MSRETVEGVRSFLGPYEGENFARAIRHAAEQLGADPQPKSVLTLWAQDPAWRHQHPDMEWDTTAIGALGAMARGPRKVASWWADWLEPWESYRPQIQDLIDPRRSGSWLSW